MIKIKLAIFFISLLGIAFKIDLLEIRLLYKEADLSKDNAIALYKKLEPVSKNDSKVLLAYKGAVLAMTARYKKSAKLKKEVFKKGVNLVEYALEQEPKNMEVRFVRLSLQQNSPRFLKYNRDIVEDKNFILSNFDAIESSTLKNYIKDYILHSNNFTEEEKNVISQP